MGDTQDKHLHYNDKGEPIHLSGLKRNNRQTKTKYQDMMERYHKVLKWEIENSRN